jgi:aryl-alcohol dehydrogenase-like predicted oxidoreductase
LSNWVSSTSTASVYGPHVIEELIREALHPYPEHVLITTKGSGTGSGQAHGSFVTPGAGGKELRNG